MGAYEILDRLRPEGFKAPAQVYRALNQLLDIGLIHKVESINAFVACNQHHQDGSSILAICDSCGAVKEIASMEFVEKIKDFGNRNNFHSRELAIELKGRCSHCM